MRGNFFIDLHEFHAKIIELHPDFTIKTFSAVAGDDTHPSYINVNNYRIEQADKNKWTCGMSKGRSNTPWEALSECLKRGF